MQQQFQTTTGFLITVDECDWDLILMGNWYIKRQKRKRVDDIRYFFTRDPRILVPHEIYGKRGEYLHRLVAARTIGRQLKKNEFVDHIDNDGLNNTRENIRVVNCAQNNFNRRLPGFNATGVRGVYPNGKRWTVIFGGHKLHNRYHGIYATLEEAAIAAVIAGKKLYGQLYVPERNMTPEMYERIKHKIPNNIL